jgi:hypothetical protein
MVIMYLEEGRKEGRAQRDMGTQPTQATGMGFAQQMHMHICLMPAACCASDTGTQTHSTHQPFCLIMLAAQRLCGGLTSAGSC